jgi:hypothetical protein
MSEERKYGYINIALDLEGTGWSMKRHGIVQLGAVVMESETRKVLETFEVDINLPEDRGWEDRCVNEFWNSKEPLRNLKKKIDNDEGEAPKVAMKKFCTFMQRAFETYAYGDINRVRILTDTVSYDPGWINLYLAEYADSKPLHLIFEGKFRDVIELGSYEQGRSGITHTEELLQVDDQKRKEGRGYFSQEKSCLKKLKITDTPKVEADHHAVNDAINMAEMFNIVMYHQ